MPPRRTKRKADRPQVDDRFQAVIDAFAKQRDVAGGKLMSSYGLKVNGKIFAMFGRNQFVAKLPKSRVDELVSANTGKRFDPGHGRTMKEWFVAGENAPEWLELAKEAYGFVKRGSS